MRFPNKKLSLERCKGVHFVDLGERFPTHIYLQNFGFDTAEKEPFKVSIYIFELERT